MSEIQSPQILVVGAGPSGLVLALSLLKNGVTVRIIEKRADSKVGDRGAGVMPRTIEIEHFLGIDKEVLAEGIEWATMYIYDPEDPYRVAKSMPMAERIDPTPAFPVMKGVMLGQEWHQAIFRKHIEALGGHVEFNTTLVGLQQDEGGVTAEISTAVDGKETVEESRFSFVIGADGAHSVVRKTVGIQFVGETRETITTLLDAEVEGVPKGESAMRFWGDQSKGIVSVRNTCKYNGFHLLFAAGANHEALKNCDAETATKELQRITRRNDLKVTKIMLHGEWRPNIRLADKFQVGRVFIVGDAAHAHPPTGGQGMNTSVQDSFNLAWKLALVTKGHSSQALLDSYQLERMPVTARMLNMTTNIFNHVGDAVTIKTKEHTEALSENEKTTQNEQSWTRGREVFQLDIHYRWSEIVFDERYARAEDGGDPYGLAGHDTRAGDRAPDAPDLRQLEDAAESTRLHDLFKPSTHTVLVFARPVRAMDADSMLEPLKTLRADDVELSSVQVIYILAKTTASGSIQVGSKAYEDAGGHAFRAYGVDPSSESPTVVIVRPDGMIGAFAISTTGVQKYVGAVFKP